MWPHKKPSYAHHTEGPLGPPFFNMPNYDDWIESHINLADHPKVHNLSRTLCVRYPDAIGTLHLLWWYTMRFAWRDGDLSKHGGDAIEGACKWAGERGDLVKALQSTGWLDDFHVHDWLDFAGRLVNDRLRYERTNAKRTRSVRKTYAARTPHVANQTLPDLTLPDLTKREEKVATIQADFKQKHMDFVYLSNTDVVKLATKMSPKQIADYTDRLNGYIGQIGEKKAAAKYKSHYHTILNWHRRDIEDGKVKPFEPRKATPVKTEPPVPAEVMQEGAEFFGNLKDTLKKGAKEIPKVPNVR